MDRVHGSGVTEPTEEAFQAKEDGHRGPWLTLSCADLTLTRETTIAKPNIALTEFVEKGADADLLELMIQCVVQRMMVFDVESLCGAGSDVKSPDRTNSRNGYRDRLWQTRAGNVDLKDPHTAPRQFLHWLPRTMQNRLKSDGRSHSRKAHIQGVSTRSDDELVKAMGMADISKGRESRLAGEIDKRVNAFQDRLHEGDATFVNVREKAPSFWPR